MKIKRVSDIIARNFKMRICHISDTHGGFPTLYGRYDAVVHSGDFFANGPSVGKNDKTDEIAYQLVWLQKNLPEMKKQLRGHPYLFIPGNHDFLPPNIMEQLMKDAGINAINLTDKLVTLEGVNFYGFPYVPAINGGWNYEREVPEMQIEADKMAAQLNSAYTDVLVCHSPLHKILDLSYGNLVLGSTVISDTLNYKVNKNMVPANYLCGHIHESHGLTVKDGMLISNAATALHIIEV